MRAEHNVTSPPSVPAWVPPPIDRDESALEPYVDAVRSHAKLFVLIVLVAVAGSIAWLAHREPEYRADAEILVSPLPADETSVIGLPVVRDAGDPTRTIQTAAALVDSDAAAARAAQKLGAPWTRKRVKAAVQVKPQGETNILEITATANGPRVAARLANAYTTGALDVRRQTLHLLAKGAIPGIRARLRALPPASLGRADLERLLNRLESVSTGPDPTLSLSQLASPPSASTGSPAWLIVALATLAGIVLATGTALLVETLRPARITSEDDLVAIYPLPVLARLPRMLRGSRQIISTELRPGAREALRSVQVQLDLRDKGGHTIMITSPSPTDGKTTTAVAFGIALAETGARVILIDTDVRRNAHHGLAAGPSKGAPPRWPGRPASNALNTFLRPVPSQPSVQVIDARDFAYDSADARSQKRFTEIVREAASTADYVILDTPPLGVLSDALTMLDLVDHVVLVARPRSTKRFHVEVTRDLLMRAGTEAAGFVVIGEVSDDTYPYYA
jgi:Mrp family chromosome partitioning ATPase/capsular polysaccharide biosynthesis protein